MDAPAHQPPRDRIGDQPAQHDEEHPAASRGPGLGFRASGWIATGLRLMQAALFGVILLAAVVMTHLFWPDGAVLHRYDALLIFCLTVQAALIWAGLETWEEARVILIYHLLGTAMEIFKTQVGSWHYPELAIAALWGVPLFAGFMYAAVGSFFARAWRLFDFELTDAPRLGFMLLLAAGAYLNFMTHHVMDDQRYALIIVSIVMFAPTSLLFTYSHTPHETASKGRLPLLIGFAGIAIALWVAENIATWARVWLYPHQVNGWQPVSLAKVGSWYLLMMLSFVLVAGLHRDRKPQL
ncbi:MAG: DUF817 domain-containing protein [Pseudomonadota bacterium]